MKIQRIALSFAVAISMISLVFPTVFACGKVTGGGQIEIPGGVASFGFNAMYFTQKDVLQGELNYVDHVTGDKVHAHELIDLEVWEPNEGNKPEPQRYAHFEGECIYNHESGYYFECYVEDDKEPGRADAFALEVWELDSLGNPVRLVFSVGDTLLNGNIQIHKPPK